MKDFFKRLNQRLGYARRKLRAPGRLRRAQAHLERVSNSHSPDVCKSAQEMADELLLLIRTRHVLPFRDLIADYFDMGLHLRGTNPADYVFMNEWKQALAPLLQKLSPSMREFIDNKQSHAELFRSKGFPTPHIIGTLTAEDGHPLIMPEDKARRALPLAEVLHQYKALFFKPLCECQGKGCFILREAQAGQVALGEEVMSVQDFMQRKGISSSTRLLAEEVITQHEQLAAFHPSSLNTLRLWTMWEEQGPTYFQGIVRMGRGGNCVDNAAQGGMFVRIEEGGRLGALGSSYCPFEPPFVTEHPDTQVSFGGVQLPFFNEATRMICEAHRLFPREFFDLAWDIAITPTGPVIVEVNSYGDTALMQRACGGWQRVFRERFLPAINAALRG